MTSTYVLYQYTPSLVAAVVFAILFLSTTAIHLWQRISNHTQYFNPFIVGGICKDILDIYAPQILSTPHSSQNTTNKISSYSSNHRIRGSHCLSFPHNIHYPLCNSDTLATTRPHSICGIDLPGSRPGDQVFAGRTPQLCASEIHDHHLCYGRCSLFRSSSCWRRCHERQWICRSPSYWPVDYCGRSLRPAYLFRCIHHHLHLLPLPDCPITYPGGQGSN